MPSDPRIPRALEALAGPRERFRSAVAAAAEEVRAYLAGHRAEGDGVAGTLAAELGPLGASRIDVERFHEFFGRGEPVDPKALAAVERALEILREVAAREPGGHVVEVGAGDRLRDAVDQAFGDLGRAFGAAHVVGLVRRGNFRPGTTEELLGSFPFSLWNQAERAIAPPLVVVVDGAALHGAELADFLDGGVKIVLLIQGKAPPAPLVRLITPGTFVLQTADPGELRRLAAFEGPGVAALVPDGAARFAHDPSRGERVQDRLEVASLPEDGVRGPLGGISPRQQREELEQLRALAAAAEAAPGAEAPAPGAAEEDVVGRLAAWLLSQANLKGLE